MKSKPKSDKLSYLSTIFLLFVFVVSSLIIFKGCQQEVDGRKDDIGTSESVTINTAQEKVIPVIPLYKEDSVLPELPETSETKEQAVSDVLVAEGKEETKEPETINPPETPVEISESSGSVSIEEPNDEFGGSLDIPGAPVLYSPEVYDFGNDSVFAGVDEKEEDPWAGFVSSDEFVEVIEGYRAVSVIINGEKAGEVETNIIDGVPSFDAEQLSYILQGMLEPDYFKKTFENNEEFYLTSWFDKFGINYSFDLNNLELDFEFNQEELPLRTISVGNSSLNLSSSKYEVEGQTLLTASKVSFVSNVAAYGSVSADESFNIDSSSLNMNFSNSANLFGLVLGFTTSFSYDPETGFSYYIDNLTGTFDLTDKNVKLTFGDIGAGLGLSLIKSQFGNTAIQGQTFEQTIKIEERSLITITNNDIVIFIRTVSPGTYRLNDFVFVQGENKIKITVHPESKGEDTSFDELISLDSGFDSSLLNKAQTNWTFSASFPTSDSTTYRNTPTEGFEFPLFYNKYRTVSLNQLNVNWLQNTGLSHNITENHSLTLLFKNNMDTRVIETDVKASVGLLWANKIGLTGLTFIYNRSYSGQPSYSTSFQQKFFNDKLGKLSLAGSYSYSSTEERLDGKVSYSFTTGALNISTSGSVGYDFKDPADSFSWNLAGSTGFSFGRGVNLSLSVGLSTDLDFTSTVGLSLILGPNASSTSTATISEDNISDNNWNIGATGNIGLSVKPFGSTTNSLQFGLSNIDVANLANQNISGSWTYSGDLAGMSLSAQAVEGFSRYLTSFSASTALAYSGGYFGMAKSIGDNFLIVHPDGLLKNSGVSYSSSAQSISTEVKKVFGNALISNLSAYQKNSVIVYCESDSLFGSGGTFILGMEPELQQSFAKELIIVPTITVSGRLLKADGTPYEQYSSPLYKYTKVGDNIEVEDMSEGFFLFTDYDGRFILSGLEPGDYFFDFQVEDDWHAVCFNVPEMGESSIVVLLKDIVAGEEKEAENITIPEYNKTVVMEFEKTTTEQKFWDEIFIQPEDGTNQSDDWGFGNNFEDDFGGDPFAEEIESEIVPITNIIN